MSCISLNDILTFSRVLKCGNLIGYKHVRVESHPMRYLCVLIVKGSNYR